MAERYRIELQSTLDTDWSEWLGGLTLEHSPDGRTILTGELADQCALHGLLARIRDLGIPTRPTLGNSSSSLNFSQ